MFYYREVVARSEYMEGRLMNVGYELNVAKGEMNKLEANSSENLRRVMDEVDAHADMNMVSLDLILEKLCLEGSRKQAKHAVHALAAITKDDGLKSLSVLYKKLVDMLEEKTHLPAVLQSLGCIAQTAMPVFETREIEIQDFIRSKILGCSDKVEVNKNAKWDDKSETCLLKMYHQTKARQISMQTDASSTTAYPEYILPYLVHALAHHSCPNVEECKNVEAYEPLYSKESLLTVMSIFKTIKCSEDAFAADKSKNSHAISDLGLSITKHIIPQEEDLSGLTVSFSLPSNLYKPYVKKDNDDSPVSTLEYMFPKYTFFSLLESFNSIIVIFSTPNAI
ncbi:hypothetical protein ACFE04_029413 [Oxalis oulophora]